MSIQLPFPDDTLLASLSPARPDDLSFWGGRPSDELLYEDFIRCILHIASQRAGHLITNGIVDWIDIAAGETSTPAGEAWADPSCLRVGGVSRVGPVTILAELPARVRAFTRLFSFVTLDHPTWAEASDRQPATLLHRLIRPLVDLQRGEQDLPWFWLELILSFCSGSRLVRYGQFEPGEELQLISNRYNVSLSHLPMSAIPAGARAGARDFRMLRLTVTQWGQFQDILRAEGLIRESNLVQEHLEGT
ncbi:MAG TPA: hypothetical protein VKX16_12865 [Chloroflexota bacterium]|nr:hypothetical protein [Chloroflexota bacterium]